MLHQVARQEITRIFSTRAFRNFVGEVLGSDIDMLALQPSDLFHGRKILSGILIDELLCDGFTSILVDEERENGE